LNLFLPPKARREVARDVVVSAEHRMSPDVEIERPLSR
jgi:hypothetical protein